MAIPPQNVFIGTAGWSYPDWNQLVYPSRRPKKFSELGGMSKLFNTVEINSTYYHPQSAATSQQWLADVASHSRFRFTARIWQKLILEKAPGSISYSQADIELAKRGMLPLWEAERLGALLLQFPQSFRYRHDNRDHLSRLLDAFQEYPLVVEVRHRSWHREEVLTLLNQRGVGFANLDQPQIGQALSFTEIVSGRVAYFRFHGRNENAWLDKDAGYEQRYDYLYSAAELRDFATSIKNALRKTESTYVIFNNYPRGQAVANALYLQFALTGVKVKVPGKLLSAYPELAQVRLGENPLQTELFLSD